MYAILEKLENIERRLDNPAYRSAAKKRRVSWAFSHNDGSSWEPYLDDDAQKIGSAMSATPDGGIIHLTTGPFEVRWGSQATSERMPTPPSDIIQVNTKTGNTRIVRIDKRGDGGGDGDGGGGGGDGIYEITGSDGVKKVSGFHLVHVDEKTRKITRKDSRAWMGDSSVVDAVEIHVVPFYSVRSYGMSSTMLRMWKIELQYGK